MKTSTKTAREKPKIAAEKPRASKKKAPVKK